MISIVIPTYNERSNVGKNVEEIETILKDYDFEIIFVDDNSPDGTSEKVRDAYLRDGRVRVVKRIGRRGLSSAIFEGICNARYELCCIVDADLQYDLSKLTDAIEEFQKEPGTDLVIFSRDMIGNREKTNLSKFRYYMTTLSSRIARRIIPVSATDPNSGFFIIKRNVVESCAPQLSLIGFKFLLDVLLVNRNLSVVEVTTSFNERWSGESKMSYVVFVDLIEMFVNRYVGFALPSFFVFYGLCGLGGLVVQMLFNQITMSIVDSYTAFIAIGTLLAIPTNFLLNNLITFRHFRLREKALLIGFWKYFVICLLGLWFQLSYFTESEAYTAEYFQMILLIGCWNFLISKNLVWRVK